jgi:hypothetical protein
VARRSRIPAGQLGIRPLAYNYPIIMTGRDREFLEHPSHFLNSSHRMPKQLRVLGRNLPRCLLAIESSIVPFPIFILQTEENCTGAFAADLILNERELGPSVTRQLCGRTDGALASTAGAPLNLDRKWLLSWAPATLIG